MKNPAISVIIIFLCTNFLLPQAELIRQPQVSFPLYVVGDSPEDGSALLFVGLDPAATDTLDSSLGEAGLPPFPPAGTAFDARFILPIDNFNEQYYSSLGDFRHADFPYTGEALYRLAYQTGSSSSKIIIKWDWPNTITGRLQDIITGSLIDYHMAGKDSFVIDNPAGFPRLNLTVSYNNVAAPELKADLFFFEQASAISFGLDPSASGDIDIGLGEENAAFYRPIPDTPSYDFRFLLPNDNFSGTISSFRDFRNGTASFVGQVEYRLRFQSNTDSLVLLYNLPSNININLQDLSGGSAINIFLSGYGAQTIYDPSTIQQLKMFVNYGPSGVKKESGIVPKNMELSQNYPNPFNPSTKIKFSVKNLSLVKLQVFDILGKEAALLVNEQLTAGNYSIDFNASGLPSGTYIYQMTVDGFRISKKMVLIK
ncbi:MAG TPA: T9SS type A sorting domain-containing protein [Ignavibacteriaceae bacterium]|nr:T9SS type A sorting domain-containing protein [Ignavibacteriaceae bacterium]